MPPSEKWKKAKAINGKNSEKIEQSLDVPRKVSKVVQKKTSLSPIKQKKESIQRPQKESPARKPSKIEKKESNADRQRDGQKRESRDDNVYNDYNKNKHSDDDEEEESVEITSSDEESDIQ